MPDPAPPAPIAGVCPERFAAVREALAANFAERGDIGASVAVTLEGESVIDLWGGWLDAERTTPWGRDTLVNTFSSTKTAMALCALWLADQGDLDIDAPARRYWPGFTAKEATTRHFLAHTAGLPGWDEPLTNDDLYDWDKCVTMLGRQQPWWKPGTFWAYHGITQGYLVGEVVRRIAGRSLGTVLAEELAGPLGADFHIGTGPQCDARIGPIFPGPPDPPPEPGSLWERITRYPPFRPGAALEIAWRRAEIPAGNGYGNARALARLMSVLACRGEVGGRRLMSPAGTERALSESWRGCDPATGAETGFGVGFALNLGGLKFGKAASCFWGGSGGSLVVVDFEARLSFAYVMNKMKGAPFGDPRNMSLIAALYGAL